MSEVNQINGDITVNKAKLAIVVGRFNGFIVESLLQGALDTLQRAGIKDTDITVSHVPGALEMPLVVQKFAASGKFDAIIGIGAVIRGSTPHFDFVAGENAKALSTLALQHSIPVINAVLTTDTIEQAIERAGTKAGNKGADAAMAAMEMISLLRKIG
ncbi:MAG: 6,7-dimethyl-8-ribityllumazine synthase [Gammaproteobacteria bacterium]|jgi:6,7-dimethyl-8-ribityllumazine synthase|nr:MAG: 6,7-dimethyl-8-ribityllumazine synthase [Gammaproteobacteria bacterium]